MISSLTAEKLACARGDKTSLLRLIAGFLAPASGRILVKTAEGESDDAEERGRLVGWLGHLDGLKPQMTVLEQLTFYAQLHAIRDADLAATLAQVGLTRQAELPCRYLSAGQRRRLALARLLVSKRPLWLLDEPFAALDVAGQALVAQLMARHCGEGGIIIAATHDPLGLGNESLKL